MISMARTAGTLLLVFTLLTGVFYPLATTGVAQALFPGSANGSLIERQGRVVGSALIGQSFSSDRFFHGRPSATVAADPTDPSKTVEVPYNAAASSGSNLGPSSQALRDTIEARATAIGALPVPADLVTASGSGLDPHLTPDAAFRQVARVASARGLPEATVWALVELHTDGRVFGLLGERRVNVLALNLALEDLQR